MSLRFHSALLALIMSIGLASSGIANEIGVDDFRVSFVGADGDATRDANTPVIAYSPDNNQFLAAWSADDPDGDFRIYAQLFSAATGLPTNSAFQLSADGLNPHDDTQPAVAYNESDLEFLVVWASDLLSPEAKEIHGQRLSSHGALLGTPSFRISQMGNEASLTPAIFDGRHPAIAWGSANNQYLVVWTGDDDSGSLVDGEFEIYGQALAGSDGSSLGSNFRISVTGTDGDADDDSVAPDVAYSPAADGYVVVWEADMLVGPGYGPEIFSSHIDENNFDILALEQISQTGGVATFDRNGRNPAIEYNPVEKEHLVVWQGDDATDEELEIWSTRLNPDGTLAGAPSAVSDMGPPNNAAHAAIHPDVSVDTTANQYLVTWQGDDSDSEWEIYGQLLSSTGGPIGSNDFRVSTMGPDGATGYAATAPGIVFGTFHQTHLILWSGDDDVAGLASGEREIFGQLWGSAPTAVESPLPLPRQLMLHTPSPNPFNPTTVIRYEVPQAAGLVSLDVYDVRGRHVATLVSSAVEAGRHFIRWNGTDEAGAAVASGVYILRLTAGSHSRTAKLTLVE